MLNIYQTREQNNNPKKKIIRYIYDVIFVTSTLLMLYIYIIIIRFNFNNLQVIINTSRAYREK